MGWPFLSRDRRRAERNMWGHLPALVDAGRTRSRDRVLHHPSPIARQRVAHEPRRASREPRRGAPARGGSGSRLCATVGRTLRGGLEAALISGTGVRGAAMAHGCTRICTAKRATPGNADTGTGKRGALRAATRCKKRRRSPGISGVTATLVPSWERWRETGGWDFLLDLSRQGEEGRRRACSRRLRHDAESTLIGLVHCQTGYHDGCEQLTTARIAMMGGVRSPASSAHPLRALRGLKRPGLGRLRKLAGELGQEWCRGGLIALAGYLESWSPGSCSDGP